MVDYSKAVTKPAQLLLHVLYLMICTLFFNTVSAFTDTVGSFAWSPDGSFYAIGRLTHEVELYSEANDELLYTLYGHTGEVFDVQFNVDSTRLASASADGSVRIWDVATGEMQYLITNPYAIGTEPFFSVTWGATPELIAVGGFNPQVRVYDVISKERINSSSDHMSAVFAVAWSPQTSLLVSGDRDGVLILWNPVTNEVLEILDTGLGITSLTWNPDGTRLAVGDTEGHITIWDAGIQHIINEVLASQSFIHRLAWSPCGDYIASSHDHGLSIWDAETGQLIQAIEAGVSVDGVGWNPNDGSLTYVDALNRVVSQPVAVPIDTFTP